MIEIPEEIKELFRSDNRLEKTQKKFKLSFYNESFDTLYPYETLFPDENLFPSERENPWLLIENDRIDSESLIISEALSETEDLDYGSCETTMFEVVVADVIEDVTGKEFTATVEIGGYEIFLGIYKVSSFVRQADRRKRKITAYDRMTLFDVNVSDWYNSLTFPLTLKSFRYSLCDYIGVEQENRILPLDSMQITKTIEPSELSGLDALRMICQINVRFGHINKMGKLEYKGLQQTGLFPAEDLFPDEDLFPTESGGDGVGLEIIEKYKQGMTYEDYLVEGITGLSIRQEENDIGANVGYGDNSYAIEGNFLVYGKSALELLNIAHAIFPEIQGRTYRPAKIECNAMPWVEVGDLLLIPTKDDVVETFVMKRTINGCQAMTDSIESTGNNKREEKFGVNKRVIQLEGKATIIEKNVEGVSVRVTNLKEQTESQFEITYDKIKTEVTRLDREDGKLSSRITQNADSITSEVTRATKAEGTLSSRITQNADQISLRVAKGSVSSEISLESGRVTLSGNRLVVNSTNFKLDENGNATFTGDIQGASGTYYGDLVVNNVNQSRFPVRITNPSGGSYIGIGATGFLVAGSGYYIRLEYDQNEGMPRLSGGKYNYFNPETFEIQYGENLARFDADGGIKGWLVYENTTHSEANIHVSSNGYFRRVSSSSRRYKTNESEELFDLNPRKLYKLPVKTYKYKNGYLKDGDSGIGKTFIGFIAEDVDQIYPLAADYENGIPETWNVKIIVPAMLKLIQEQNERIIKLEEKNEDNYI